MPKLTLQKLIKLPWRIRGPKLQRDEHGNQWWEIRVDELPEFMVAAETADEAIRDYLPALKAFLASYTERGETPPLPKIILETWVVTAIDLRPRPGQSHHMLVTPSEGSVRTGVLGNIQSLQLA